MNISTSPDITKLEVGFVVDLSEKIPKLVVENHCEGPNLAGVVLAFEAYSPNNIPIHFATLDAADAQASFDVLEIPSTFPLFNRAVEWSGSQYRFVVKAMDSLGTIFTDAAQLATICAPRGNRTAGNNYGGAEVNVEVDCNRGEAQIKDKTNYSYNGKDAQIIDSTITVIYPADETGVVPAPKVYDGFSQVIEQLSYSGSGFTAVVSSTRRYDLGSNVSVVIRYVKAQPFDVNCNYDLCPLFSEYSKLLDKAQNKCDAALDHTISQINAKLIKAVIAKMQPACGYNLGKIIDDIKEIGGFKADCRCSTSVGFSVKGNSTGGLNIQFALGGDITASSQINGGNVLLNIADFTYTFRVAPFGNVNSPQSFNIGLATNGTSRVYTLTVNRALLAGELLTTIGNNQALLDQLRTLTAANFDFIVDGKGIIQTNERCDQDLTIVNFPKNTTFKQIKSITIDQVLYPLNLSINGTSGSLAKLNIALQAINKGIITATFEDPDILHISTVQNAHKINGATIFSPADNSNAPMNVRASNCTNSLPYQPSVIVQAIIDYIMKLTADNVTIGSNFSFCQLNADGSVNNITFKETDSLSVLLAALRDNSCRAVSGGSSVSCASIQALFKDTTEKIQPTDHVLGTRNGKCGVWDITDIVNEAMRILTTTNDQALKDKWCQAVAICSNISGNCNAVSFLETTYEPIKISDFLFVGNDLVYAGRYVNDTLDGDVHIVMVNENIATGTRGLINVELVMATQTNIIDNALATLGSPGVGYRWAIQSIQLPIVIAGATQLPDKNYLHVRWLNNGAATYKVAYRVKGSGVPFSYVAINAQPGKYTVLVYDVAQNSYEASLISVCGPNVESAAVVSDATTCPPVTTFNVVKTGANFEVTYKFPETITKFNLRVTYPNNGKFNQVLDIQGTGKYLLPVPSGISGDYVFDIRAVCNEANGWFSDFSGTVVVNVPASSNACPVVRGVTVSNILDTTADVTVIPPLETLNVLGYTVILTAAGEAAKTLNIANPTLIVSFSGLTANKQYTVNVIVNCVGGGTGDSFNGGTFFTAGSGSTFRAYYGIQDTNALPSHAQIEASAHNAEFLTGQKAIADWQYNIAPKFLWIAVPSAQPDYTEWYASSVNRGGFGGFPPETFASAQLVPGVGAQITYKVYISNFKTSQSNSTVEFRP